MHANQLIHLLKSRNTDHFYQKWMKQIVLVLSSYTKKIRELILLEEEQKRKLFAFSFNLNHLF